jgi:mRNA-degrading endonuclease RelE of RelBE toxin-antitoxin system
VSWVCELTESAKEDLKDLPRDAQERLGRALDQMSLDPFQGDVKALQGKEWKGVFRRRAGAYRIMFMAHHKEI